jgi:hypothetical protein
MSLHGLIPRMIGLVATVGYARTLEQRGFRRLPHPSHQLRAYFVCLPEQDGEILAKLLRQRLGAPAEPSIATAARR